MFGFDISLFMWRNLEVVLYTMYGICLWHILKKEEKLIEYHAVFYLRGIEFPLTSSSVWIKGMEFVLFLGHLFFYSFLDIIHTKLGEKGMGFELISSCLFMIFVSATLSVLQI